MLDALKGHDPDLVELPCGAGGIIAAPGLQGRIFCRMGSEIVHRLDLDCLKQPPVAGFRNIGGNSLWPAPEGGPFAFNYLPDSDDWLVQQDVGSGAYTVVHANVSSVSMGLSAALRNRAGAKLELQFHRHVERLLAFPLTREFALNVVGYRCTDTITPVSDCLVDKALIAPWSLEQFPGGDGVVAFCKVAEPEGSINFDFYADPGDCIQYHDGFFTFALASNDRHQIGINKDRAPELIGALDPERRLLMLRRTPLQEGAYFNIADNDQTQGPFSVTDVFSIFNGGDGGFFELETIGAMQTDHGFIAPCSLVSETVMLKGSLEELLHFLRKTESIDLEGIVRHG